MPGAAELSSWRRRANSGLAEAAELLAKVGEADPVTSRPGPSEAVSLMVQLGAGLPALAKRLVDKIEADEYIDFGDLPPAKGKGRPLGQAFEGQVVVVQAADLVQTRKLIPDVATWVQCFGLFAAAVARKKPQRLPDMMAYMTIVTKASQKYKWPAWVIYDQNFKMEAAGDSPCRGPRWSLVCMPSVLQARHAWQRTGAHCARGWTIRHRSALTGLRREHGQQPLATNQPVKATWKQRRGQCASSTISTMGTAGSASSAASPTVVATAVACTQPNDAASRKICQCS